MKKNAIKHCFLVCIVVIFFLSILTGPASYGISRPVKVSSPGFIQKHCFEGFIEKVKGSEETAYLDSLTQSFFHNPEKCLIHEPVIVLMEFVGMSLEHYEGQQYQASVNFFRVADLIMDKYSLQGKLTPLQHKEWAKATYSASVSHGFYLGNSDDAKWLSSSSYDQFQEANDTLGMARSLYVRASAARRLGSYYQALSDAKNAAALFDLTSETYNYRIRAIIANIYYGLSMYEMAAAYGEEILEKSKGIVNEVSYAIYENNQATYLLNLGRSKASLIHAQNAVETFSEHKSMRNLSIAYSNLGRSYFEMSQYDAAKDALDRSKQLSKGKSRLIDVNYHLAKWFEKTGNSKQNYDSAIHYYQQSLFAETGLAIDSILIEPEQAIKSATKSVIKNLSFMANCMKEAYSGDTIHLKRALKIYESAIQTLDRLRKDQNIGEGSNLRFSESHNNLFENAIGTCHSLYNLTNDEYYAAKAFYFSEVGKSVNFKKYSLLRKVLKNLDLDDSLKSVYLSYSANVSSLEFGLINLAKEHEKSLQIDSLERELSKARLMLSSLRNHLSYDSVYIEQAVKTLWNSNNEAQLRKILKTYSTAVISYFQGEESIIGMSYIQGRYHMNRIDTQKLMPRLIDHLAHVSQVPNAVFQLKEIELFQGNAYKLFKLLLESPLSKIHGHKIKQLLLLPDGILHQLPFQTLVTSIKSAPEDYSELDYLVKKINVNYLFSIYQRDNLDLNMDGGVLAFSFSEDNQSANLNNMNISNLRSADASELPGSYQELKAIYDHFEGDFFTGVQANKTLFKNRVKENNRAILHLALHGQSNASDIAQAFLKFNDQSDFPESGLLSLAEIRQTLLSQDLVVLSACESNVGSIQKGEGVYSLAREFIATGCSSSISSLWKIEDIATARLMAGFYDALSAQHTPSNALQTAQLSIISEQKYAHPFYWGGLIYHGNQMSTNDEFWPGWYFLIALAILFIIFWVFQQRTTSK